MYFFVYNIIEHQSLQISIDAVSLIEYIKCRRLEFTEGTRTLLIFYQKCYEWAASIDQVDDNNYYKNNITIMPVQISTKFGGYLITHYCI